MVNPSTPAPQPTKPPVKCVPGLCPEIKQPESGVDHPPLFRAEVKRTVLPLWAFMDCAKANFTYSENGKCDVLKHTSVIHNTVIYPTIRQTLTIVTVKFQFANRSIPAYQFRAGVVQSNSRSIVRTPCLPTKGLKLRVMSWHASTV
jgi:hypothetical protein